MGEKNGDEFADVAQAAGGIISLQVPLLGSDIFLVNASKQKVMQLRRRLFNSTEEVLWRGFSGVIEHGVNEFELKAACGKVLGTAKAILQLPVTITVGEQSMTYDHVKGKWWNPNLVLKDDQGDIIIGSYNSREFQLLRAIDSLSAALAMYWIISRQDQS